MDKESFKILDILCIPLKVVELTFLHLLSLTTIDLKSNHRRFLEFVNIQDFIFPETGNLRMPCVLTLNY